MTGSMTDSQLLAAASENSDDWGDDTWAAWGRIADRAHSTSGKQDVANLRAACAELEAKLATAERQTAELGQKLTDIRHLHTDSPMGPCPVCIDGDAQAAGGDGLISYPCPTARLAGATDCEPKRVTA